MSCFTLAFVQLSINLPSSCDRPIPYDISRESADLKTRVDLSPPKSDPVVLSQHISEVDRPSEVIAAIYGDASGVFTLFLVAAQHDRNSCRIATKDGDSAFLTAARAKKCHT